MRMYSRPIPVDVTLNDQDGDRYVGGTVVAVEKGTYSVAWPDGRVSVEPNADALNAAFTREPLTITEAEGNAMADEIRALADEIELRDAKDGATPAKPHKPRK